MKIYEKPSVIVESIEIEETIADLELGNEASHGANDNWWDIINNNG